MTASRISLASNNPESRRVQYQFQQLYNGTVISWILLNKCSIQWPAVHFGLFVLVHAGTFQVVNAKELGSGGSFLATYVSRFRVNCFRMASCKSG